MKFQDLDYFQTKSGIIFIVRGNLHPDRRVLACPVYWPDTSGDRISYAGDRYRKEIIEVADDDRINLTFADKSKFVPRNGFLVPLEQIIKRFDPRKCVNKFKIEFAGTVWRSIYDEVSRSGVAEKDMGIFGSYLVGLYRNMSGEMVKDIDFLVYGLDNCILLKSKMNRILAETGLSPISKQHIKYETQKLGRMFSTEHNSFGLTLANKWSSIQIAPGILTTIRFVARPGEIALPDTFFDPIAGEGIFKGTIVDDFGLNFVPRQFKMMSGGKLYKVITYFWVYHQAVRVGQCIEIRANVHQSGLLSIDRYSQGIKVLGEDHDQIFSLQPRNMHKTQTARGGADRFTRAQ